MEAASEVVAPVIIVAIALVIAAPILGLMPSPFGTEPNVVTAALRDMVKDTNALLLKSSVKLKHGFNIYAGEGNAVDLDPDLSGARSIIFETSFGETFDVTVTGRGIKSIEFSEQARVIMLESDGTAGMVKIAVPKELLGDEFNVKVSGQEADFKTSENETQLEVQVYRPADSNIIFVLGTPMSILQLP
ncbi:MAG: hypothetical protein ACE5KA_08665 [Nitrososphaerales archaeon]